MFNNRLRNSLLGGIAIGALATIGFAPEANAQELIRSNITPRSVRSNVVPSDVAPGVRSNLSTIANDLNTTVDALLSDPTIGEVSISPSGAEVLTDLQAAGAIDVDSQGNIQVEQQQVPRVGQQSAETQVLSIDPPSTSVEQTRELIEN